MVTYIMPFGSNICFRTISGDVIFGGLGTHSNQYKYFGQGMRGTITFICALQVMIP